LLIVALLACAPGCGGGQPEAPPIPLGQPVQGRATYYDANGDGACGFGPSSDLMVAALDEPQWENSGLCGACAQVMGPMATITVRIVDECPGCEPGHLDLSAQAFAMIADPTLGNVPITWQLVSCTVTAPIDYHYKDGANQWWTAIQIRNSRLPVTTLEAMQNGTWVSIPRTDYNYFVAASGLGPNPLTLRVTAIDGEQLIDTIPAVSPNQDYAGASQFTGG
jgi:expansin (peptidoglycan-binding protein)